MLTVGKDALEVERRLRAGLLECPVCGGRLAPWGWARQRLVFDVGRVTWRLRPRRGCCAGCAATHVLLPVSVLLRRRDAVAVIGMALDRAGAGVGCAVIARALDRPVVVVRGWVGRFAGRAELIRGLFTVLLVELDPDPPVIEVAGSLVADAIAAVFAVAGAAGRRWGQFVTTLSPWELACAITSGTLLAPSISVSRINTNYIL